LIINGRGLNSSSSSSSATVFSFSASSFFSLSRSNEVSFFASYFSLTGKMTSGYSSISGSSSGSSSTTGKIRFTTGCSTGFGGSGFLIYYILMPSCCIS